MGLRVFNTMGREMQDFVPITPGFVGFYGCGPTVYNYAHIGNLRAYVFLDILDRTLSYLGYDKKHVMNITDIGHLTGDDDSGEDKIVKTAKERHQSVLEVAQFYTDAFFKDLDALNIRRPDVVCKATDHVSDMIELIKRIEANGHTYMSGGNLYYDVSTYADYGKLANLRLDDQKAGARVGVDENKRNPYDFVLWFTKSKFENQALSWESPWGKGYPGWHIECSAMSMKYLGDHFDIHTGGIDHIPIHHTNEIAQSEGATGKKWVNYWLHNEFLVVKNDASGDGDKMSKSAGNFLRLQTLADKGYDALDYRYFLLGAQYRSQVFFSWDAMESAKNARKALVKRAAQIIEASHGKVSPSLGKKAQGYIDSFKAALENDLATPLAMSALHLAVKDSERKKRFRSSKRWTAYSRSKSNRKRQNCGRPRLSKHTKETRKRPKSTLSLRNGRRRKKRKISQKPIKSEAIWHPAASSSPIRRTGRCGSERRKSRNFLELSCLLR